MPFSLILPLRSREPWQSDDSWGVDGEAEGLGDDQQATDLDRDTPGTISPGSQLMSCRTDRTIPSSPSAPAQAINVIAPAPGETR